MKRNADGLICLLLLLVLASACASAPIGESPGSEPWRAWADPAAAGWSREGLAAARRFAEKNEAGAVLLIEQGRVVVGWGEIDRPLPLYSMRKGIYNALIGMLIEEGKLDLDATLAVLEIDDVGGLSAAERSATLAQVLASRSGVYHQSAYEPASMKRGRPERGVHAPGENFYYNNWDFNLAAHLIEKAAGESLSRQFRQRLAIPLSMEDWTEEDVFEFFEPSRSRYAAPILRLSARDLARFGQLYLQGGRWEGRRLLSERWIRESWTPRTVFADGSPWEAGAGFGYLWWVHPRRENPSSLLQTQDIYLTRGSDGQVLAIVPELDLVYVHQTDTENGLDGSFEGAMQLLAMLVDARSGESERGAAQTAAVEPEPFDYARPARRRLEPVAWTEGGIAALVGTYALAPGITFRVHNIGNRLFALPQGVPLAEVELFRSASGELFSPAVSVSLRATKEESGVVRTLEGLVEGRPVRLTRVE